MAQSVARGSPAAGLPARISPQLTQLEDAAAEGDDWLQWGKSHQISTIWKRSIAPIPVCRAPGLADAVITEYPLDAPHKKGSDRGFHSA
jgi:hypothetical protein